MRSTRCCGLLLTSLIVVSQSLYSADAPEFPAFDRSFQSDIRPIISRVIARNATRPI